MRVLAFPKGTSAYTECFYRALEALGVPVVDGVMSGGWLRANVRRGDWLHLHWPSFEYAFAPGAPRQVVALARLTALLALARLRGARIAWTAHNLLPHDRASWPPLDVIARRVVIALADVIPVHGRSAARVLTARFPAAARKLVEVPHGHWIDHYVRTESRADARAKLGLDANATVYAFVGLCKPYKNLEALVRAFATVPGPATLLIAGKFPDARYAEAVRSLAAQDPRVRIDAGFVPDERIQTYLVAADVVVAPYREILTSGTAMLAQSFGRPVVSVAQGFLLDVVDESSGILYAPDDPQALPRALAAVRTRSFDEQHILAQARRHTFEAAAARFASALRDADAGRAPAAGDTDATP